MNRQERLHSILSLLDQEVPHPKIALHFTSPFTLLVAVLLSARCTDERVNRVTPTLFALAHTPKQMAELDPKQIEPIIRTCGLAPTKSRALVRLSQKIMNEHGGQVPRSLSQLEELPGVGHKTASVVVSQAFHKRAFPVDTHIHRLAKRWGLSRARNVRETERDLKRLIRSSAWNRRHLQMILYARKCCPARGHTIEKCPICNYLALRPKKVP